MRTRSRILVFSLAVGLVMSLGPTSGARDAPLRSGRIIGGYMVMGPNGIHCASAPDCALWLHSGCDPALAGRSPASQTSIVKVGAFSGTPRRFRFVNVPGGPMPANLATGFVWAAVHLEFFDASCRHVGPNVVLDDFHDKTRGVRFTVPPGARFMTVPILDGVNVRWELT